MPFFSGVFQPVNADGAALRKERNIAPFSFAAGEGGVHLHVRRGIDNAQAVEISEK